MSKNQKKKKWNKLSKELRSEIGVLCKDNPVFCMAIRNAYLSYAHHKYIMEIWYLLGTKHKETWKEVNKELFGKTLCGDFSINITIRFICPEIYKKWSDKLPERYILASCYSEAMKAIRVIQEES